MGASGSVQPVSARTPPQSHSPGLGTEPKRRFVMTSIRNSLIAVLDFTVVAALIVASAFAADGDNGNSKRRGDNGKLKTGTFQIVVPKADRAVSGPTAQFVAPKADRSNSSGPRTPTLCSRCRPRRPGRAMARSQA